MKRFLALLLCLITVISLFSCAEVVDPTEETTESKTEKKTEKKEEKTKEPKKEYIIPKVPVRVKNASTGVPDIKRYEDQIKAFEMETHKQEGCILFYGSSGFTRWAKNKGNTPLADAILSKDGNKICVNHGFGGSTWHELCYYYERAVKPWKPKAIVITVLINDLDFQYTNEEIMILTNWFCKTAKEDFPDIKIYMTDVRPRNGHNSDAEIARYMEINKLTKEYCEKTENVNFIETSKWGFYYLNNDASTPYKNINPAMFVDDNTHYTTKGYEGFADGFRKAIDEVL